MQNRSTEPAVSLKDALESYIRENVNRSVGASQSYWYPLCMPTYDVEEIFEAVQSMCAFQTTMGEKTQHFEREFSAYQGCSDSVMVNSGSSADLLMAYLLVNRLKQLVEPGSEILMPVLTWPTQVWSAMMAGLKVRFVDIDPHTLNMDLDDLEKQITAKTSSIFLVHLMGNPCNMDRVNSLVKKHNLVLLEDCCESLGASWRGKKVGNFGVAGSFSFFYAHHMTTMEGGMISCNDAEIADHLRMMRAHGWLRNATTTHYEVPADIDARFTFVNWGFNVRPTELQAGFGLHQLRKLPSFNRRRTELATKFFAYIDTIGWFGRPEVSEGAEPCWFSLPLVVSQDAPFEKADLIRFLEKKGVETRPMVAGNLSRHPVAKLFPEFSVRDYPGADLVHANGFYMGLSPMLHDESIDRLIDAFQEFCARY